MIEALGKNMTFREDRKVSSWYALPRPMSGQWTRVPFPAGGTGYAWPDSQ